MRVRAGLLRSQVLPGSVPSGPLLQGPLPSRSLLQGELWLCGSELCRSDLRGSDLRCPRPELRGRPELRDGADLLRSQVLQGSVPPGPLLQGSLPSRSLLQRPVPSVLPCGPGLWLRRLATLDATASPRGREGAYATASVPACGSYAA